MLALALHARAANDLQQQQPLTGAWRVPRSCAAGRSSEMPSRKATTVQTPRPQIVVMSATGATLLLPDVRQEQAVEVQYGYRFKGKWKPSQVVDRLAGSPVCVTVAGLKPSRTYVFRARAQASADVGSSWGDWSAASDTGKTSADLAAAVSAQLPAAHGREEPIDRHRDPGLDHRDALRERPGRPVASAAAGPGPPSAGRREDADLAVAIAASLAEASGTAPAVAAPAGSLYDSMDADLAAAIAASIADVRQSEAAEEAEPPCDAMPAEDLPPPRRQRDRERVRERPRELDQRTPQQVLTPGILVYTSLSLSLCLSLSLSLCRLR